MQTLSLRGLAGLIIFLVGWCGAAAQPAATGVVTGRVFNAATKGYVRNAEVRVEGTNVVAYLPKGQQAAWRRQLQAAYERPSYAEAKAVSTGRLISPRSGS